MSEHKKISEAPTFMQIQAFAEANGIPIERLIQRESEKRYMAVRDKGLKTECDVLIQNPALMTYQQIMARGKPTHEVFIERTKSEVIENGKGSGSKQWLSELKNEAY